MLKTALLLTFSAVFLTACGTEPPRLITKVETIRPEIPPQLTDCMEAPRVPGEAATQRDVAGYILDLVEAHADCHATVRALNEVVR